MTHGSLKNPGLKSVLRHVEGDTLLIVRNGKDGSPSRPKLQARKVPSQVAQASFARGVFSLLHNTRLRSFSDKTGGTPVLLGFLGIAPLKERGRPAHTSPHEDDALSAPKQPALRADAQGHPSAIHRRWTPVIWPVLAIFLVLPVLSFAGSAKLELEYSSGNLSSWQRVPLSVGMLHSGNIELGDLAAGDSAFFRLKVALNATPSAPAGMVFVQGGTFPVDSIYGAVSVESFFIHRTEVTVGEWNTVRNWAVQNGYSFNNSGAGNYNTHPVYSMSWGDAIIWCNAKSEREGLVPFYRYNNAVLKISGIPNDRYTIELNWASNGYRLPLEAEWEWAARGGLYSMGYVYSGSNDISSAAWYYDNTFPNGPKVVATKLPNELGLYDMSGGVAEWCWDGVVGQLSRRVRGGSWGESANASAILTRSAAGTYDSSIYRGFRPVKNIPSN